MSDWDWLVPFTIIVIVLLIVYAFFWWKESRDKTRAKTREIEERLRKLEQEKKS